MCFAFSFENRLIYPTRSICDSASDGWFLRHTGRVYFTLNYTVNPSFRLGRRCILLLVGPDDAEMACAKDVPCSASD